MNFSALKWILWKLRILIKVIDKFDAVCLSMNDTSVTVDCKIELYHYELHPKIAKLFK